MITKQGPGRDALSTAASMEQALSEGATELRRKLCVRCLCLSVEGGAALLVYLQPGSFPFLSCCSVFVSPLQGQSDHRVIFVSMLQKS